MWKAPPSGFAQDTSKMRSYAQEQAATIEALRNELRNTSMRLRSFQVSASDVVS